MPEPIAQPNEGDPTPTGSGNGGESSGDPQNPQPTPASPQPPSGTAQSEFKHTLLKGKSPEEIEMYVRTLETANREQANALRTNNSRSPQPSPEPVAPSRQTYTDDQFWQKPIETLRGVVSEMLETTIAPFRADLALSRAAGSWTEIRGEFSDFASYEPMVRQLCDQYKLDAPTVENLRSFYYMAKGFVMSQPEQPAIPGVPAPAAPVPLRPNAPPQHPASSHPLPSQTPISEIPNLTESERRLAREMNPHLSPEDQAREFRRWQMMDSGDVLNAERKPANG